MSLYLDRATFQLKATNHLKKIVNSERIPHALLFRGPEGVGKHFVALQFIKELNSLRTGDIKYKSKINELEEPFVKFVCALPRGSGESSDDKPTAKLNETQLESVLTALKFKRSFPFSALRIEKAQNIKISSIREIRRYLSMNYEPEILRVIMLNEAHKMSIDSQNAILKSLEEPPENTLFILHTSDYQSLLPTIQSRCQEVIFNPLASEDLVKILEEYYEYDKSLIKLVSNFSEGSVTKAIKLLDNGFEDYLEKCINILRFALARRYNTAFNYIDDIVKSQGAEGFYICLEMMCKWFLDVIRDREGLEIEYFDLHINTIKKFNEKYPHISVEKVLSQLLNYSSFKETNINLNICISNVIFEIGHIGIG
jgi:DNA polymerase-3 subunit delta'